MTVPVRAETESVEEADDRQKKPDTLALPQPRVLVVLLSHHPEPCGGDSSTRRQSWSHVHREQRPPAPEGPFPGSIGPGCGISFALLPPLKAPILPLLTRRAKPREIDIYGKFLLKILANLPGEGWWPTRFEARRRQRRDLRVHGACSPHPKRKLIESKAMAGPSQLIQIEVFPPPRAPKPQWLRAKAPVGDNFHNLKKLARGLGLAHRVRVGAVPEHRRVLEPQDCDVYVAGRHLHAALRLLRRTQGTTGADRLG